MLKFNQQYNQLLRQAKPKAIISNRSIIRDYHNILKESDGLPRAADTSKYDATAITNLIAAVRKYVMDVNPYFGLLLQQMPIIMTFDIETMAVDHKANLYINPDFVLELGKGYIETTASGFKINQGNNPIAFVIAHEVYHIFNRTFARERHRNAVIVYGDRPINLWNIATDFEMNYRLQYDFGMPPPEGGMLCDSDGVGHFWVTDKKYHVKGSSAERLYDLMLKDCKEIEELQNKYIPGDKPATTGHKFKPGDLITIAGTDPPEWHEVVSVLSNGDLDTKNLNVPKFPDTPIKVIEH